MSKSFFENVIASSQGRFVTVFFVKQDGTERALNGRMARNDDPKYITMYDVKNNGYRSVNRETIFKVKAEGVTITR